VPLRLPVVVRKTHKWLALAVGVQLVIWSLTGLYMTTVHIDIIHGDHLVRAQSKRTVDAAELTDPLRLAAGAQSIRLAFAGERPLWVVGRSGREHAYDARSGAAQSPPGKTEIRALATALYTGTEPIASARLIDELPGEVRGRKPPLWRVEFDHWNKPTLYLSPVTGELVTRRHELWRLFDIAWMLHIMDYRERENVNNWLLRAFTWGAVLTALSGAWLLLFAFPRKKKKSPTAVAR
jgi:hypothetical protein